MLSSEATRPPVASEGIDFRSRQPLPTRLLAACGEPPPEHAPFEPLGVDRDGRKLWQGPGAVPIRRRPATIRARRDMAFPEADH